MTPPTAGPDLHLARAHWVSRHLIVWPAADIPSGMAVDSLDWRLHWSNDQPIDPWAPEPVPTSDGPRSCTPCRFWPWHVMQATS